jgi:hypothetical protein
MTKRKKLRCDNLSLVELPVIFLFLALIFFILPWFKKSSKKAKKESVDVEEAVPAETPKSSKKDKKKKDKKRKSKD